jgi:Translation initiation factor IF-3, C-terminal domain
MDYGKWRYEQEQKAKQARKHQSTITIKEIKFRPKIDPHDYETKKGHVLRFLKNKDKVKVTIMFRGRELMHPERGEAILLQLAEEVQDLATIESQSRWPQHDHDARARQGRPAEEGKGPGRARRGRARPGRRRSGGGPGRDLIGSTVSQTCPR